MSAMSRMQKLEKYCKKDARFLPGLPLRNGCEIQVPNHFFGLRSAVASTRSK